MSKNTKIVLIVVASLAGLFVLAVAGLIVAAGAFLSHSLASDPASKARAAAKIATFTLPRGYRYLMAIDLPIADTVIIVPDGLKLHPFTITLMGTATGPASKDPNDLARSMQRSMGSSAQCSDPRPAGTDALTTAGGTPVTLSAFDCAQNGTTLEVGTIPSHFPFAILAASGPRTSFDRNALHELVASIR